MAGACTGTLPASRPGSLGAVPCPRRPMAVGGFKTVAVRPAMPSLLPMRQVHRGRTVRVCAKLGENEKQGGGNKLKEKEKTWGWFFSQPSPATPEELDKLLVQLGSTDRSLAAVITEVAVPGTLAGLVGLAFGINAFDVGSVQPGDIQNWLVGASPLLLLDFMIFMVLPLLDLSPKPGGKGAEDGGAGWGEVTYMSTLPAALGQYPRWCREEGPLARPLLDGLPFPVVGATALGAAVAKETLVRGAVLAGIASWLAGRFSEAGLGDSLGPVLGPVSGSETPLLVALLAMGITLVTNLATADPILGLVEGFGLSLIEEAVDPDELYTDADMRLDLADDFNEAASLQNWARVLECYEEMQALSCEQIDYVSVLMACDRLKKWDYSLRVYRAMERLGAEVVPFASEALMLAAANEGEWAVVKDLAAQAAGRGDQLTTAECKALLRAAEATDDAEQARAVLARHDRGDSYFDEEMWAVLFKLIGGEGAVAGGAAAGGGGGGGEGEGESEEMAGLRARWEQACSMGWVAPPTRPDPMAKTDAPYQGVSGWTEPQLGGSPPAWEAGEIDTLRSTAYWAVLSAQFFASGGLAAPVVTHVVSDLLYVIYLKAGPKGEKPESSGGEKGAGGSAPA